ncbi:hypothetical protein PUN28_014066 [Cardiocondyla obscurior]|uniref:MYND-type domain-containing protein n=2 Tax=Cardiocondyla obscurior TaxID=286306 RepID=A0AAW2F8G9_9HYME
MAETTREEGTAAVTSLEDKMSVSSESSSADNKATFSDNEEKHKQMDVDKSSTSKEASDSTSEREITEDPDLPSVERQSGAVVAQTDCNGNAQKEIDKAKSSKAVEPEIVASEVKDVSNEEKSSSDSSFALQDNLNEILKIVHGDFAMELMEIAESEAAKGNDKRNEEGNDEDKNDKESNKEDVNEEEQQTVKKKDDALADVTPDAGELKEDSIAFVAEDKRDSRRSSEKTEEKSNFEVVRSPTAFGELIEEQLANNSELSTIDRTDHIVEWVKNSVKANANEESTVIEESNIVEECKSGNTTSDAEKRKISSITPPFVSPRKSQRLVSNIIKKSIKCLNKMHAMEGAAESKRKVDTAEDDKTSASSPSPKVPQNQQNGAALPEETAAAPTTSVSRGRAKKKDEQRCDTETPVKGSKMLAESNATIPSDDVQLRRVKAASEPVEIRKRKSSTNGQLLSQGSPRKKFRDNYTREEYIARIVGDDNENVEDLMAKADRLRADILALENLAHAKEMEWNEILRKRKLKEEAYLRLERKIQTTAYMENDVQLPETLPSGKSSLGSAEWESNSNTTLISKERAFEFKEEIGEKSSDSLSLKKEKTARVSSQQRATPPKTNGESSRKQNDASSPESRQIGEGRQGAIVDVRSIIADHRLKHPETVPRRGRRMRNSNVNINLGAGGAMLETGHSADSRPSSTESCKSNPSTNDSINYKDMLVQFAKTSQQGESIKVQQSYPDVTLHPVTPSSAQNTTPTSSLLHNILTKVQTPRSTTFSPTLARLLTAPERERSSPTSVAAAAAAASLSQQGATTQHLLQTYQGSNLVSINDLLSSSKARTEITITPVVNIPAQSHSNDLIQVEDVEEETTVIEDRKGNSVVGRDGKQVIKDNPPSPNAPPKCQGCVIRPAQFVCAGCGNQWYCSRSCQLAAWATHSDHCPPEPENNKTKTNV